METKKINPREKMLLTGFILVVMLAVFMQMFYKPMRRELSQAITKRNKLAKDIEEIQEVSPDIMKQESSIETIKNEVNTLHDQIATMEVKLPGTHDVNTFLGLISRVASRCDLLSLKHEIDREGQYPILSIELEFSAPFKETLECLYQIESLGDFLTINELNITMKTDKEKRGIVTSFVASVLLKETSSALAQTKNYQFVVNSHPEYPFTVERSIFSTPKQLASVAPQTDLKLEGITYSEKNPLAIINNEMVMIDSNVDGFKVKDILLDRVILDRNGEEYILKLER